MIDTILYRGSLIAGMLFLLASTLLLLVIALADPLTMRAGAHAAEHRKLVTIPKIPLAPPPYPKQALAVK